MSHQNIRLNVSESIATLTIGRPAVKNALNLEKRKPKFTGR